MDFGLANQISAEKKRLNFKLGHFPLHGTRPEAEGAKVSSGIWRRVSLNPGRMAKRSYEDNLALIKPVPRRFQWNGDRNVVCFSLRALREH